MKTTLAHSIAGLLIISTLTSASAANWPGWRGPDGTGVSSEKNLPLTWTPTANVRWHTDLPERGNGSPVVWGDRVLVPQAVGDRRTLMCFDRANGKLLWQSGVTYTEREQTQRDNPYCSATPVTDGERIVASFGSAGLFCYDFEGREVWHRDLGKMNHMFGNGSSPVLAGDLCVLNFGPDEKARVIAVSKRTGETVWETPAPKPEPGDQPQRGPGGGPGGERGGPGGGGRGGAGPGQMLAPQMISQADKDGDAKIGKDEFTKLTETWFDKLDKDKSGKLDSQSFGDRFSGILPPPEGAAPGGDGGRRGGGFGPARGIASGLYSATDANKDGSLTREEWTGTFSKWFGEWDAEKSGALDEAKLRDGLNAALPRPQFGGPGGGGGRGGSAGSWSTPTLIKSGGREELIVNFPSRIAALDPKTGKELWSAKGLGGASYTSPVWGEGALVATSSGPGGGAALALKPGGSGDVTESQRLWHADRFKSAIGSGVIHEGHLYTISQDGIAESVDLKMGSTVWSERLKGSGSRGSSWSSMLLADGKIYVPNQSGDVFVLSAAPKFEVLATNSVNEATNASLATADGEIFLRTDKGLWCFANSAAK